MNVEALRNLFPVYEQGVYVNHAAISPFGQRTRNAVEDWLSRRFNLPVDPYPEILKIKEAFKSGVRQFIHAESDETIAFVPNTSFGINMIATGLRWAYGDHILLNPLEFPANVYPFLNLEKQGVHIDWVEPVNGEIRIEDIEKQITERTRLLSISFVQFQNGFKADLASIGQLCKERNVLFVVDGIQGTGAAAVDVAAWHVDAWVSGGHKWLMWPMGTGFVYMKPALRDQIEPAFAGWLSVKNAWNMLDYRLDFLETAECFELGTLNFMGMSAASRMVHLFLEIGIESIEARIGHLTQMLIDGLSALNMNLITPINPAKRAGIVSLQVQEPEVLLEQLKQNQIFAAVRGDVLRFSLHAGNNEADVKKILEVLNSDGISSRDAIAMA